MATEEQPFVELLITGLDDGTHSVKLYEGQWQNLDLTSEVEVSGRVVHRKSGKVVTIVVQKIRPAKKKVSDRCRWCNYLIGDRGGRLIHLGRFNDGRDPRNCEWDMQTMVATREETSDGG